MSVATSSSTREEVFNTIIEFVNASNRGDITAALASHAPDSIVHYTGFPDMDLDACTNFYRSYYQAFPDLHIHVNPDDAIIEGNRFVGPYRVTGTQTGDFMGIPATGRKIDIFGINIFYIRDGKIVEEWALNDGLGMLRQLGVIPGPGALADC